jgi:ABC-type uncharacterized transport system substrate-binding protein
MGATGDPLASGVVSNLARPGGNITGLSAMIGEVEGKRLEFLKEIVPNLRRVAVIVNLTNRYADGALGYAQQAAKPLNLSLKVHEVHDDTTLEKAQFATQQVSVVVARVTPVRTARRSSTCAPTKWVPEVPGRAGNLD